MAQGPLRRGAQCSYIGLRSALGTRQEKVWEPLSYMKYVLLRSEIPSGMRAKLRTVAASNNRDHASRSLFAYASHYVQSFTSQYRQSFHVAISLIIACSRYIYNGVILHAHPVRGESHNQRNATGEVATVLSASNCISIGHIQWQLVTFGHLLLYLYETHKFSDSKHYCNQIVTILVISSKPEKNREQKKSHARMAEQNKH